MPMVLCGDTVIVTRSNFEGLMGTVEYVDFSDGTLKLRSEIGTFWVEISKITVIKKSRGNPSVLETL